MTEREYVVLIALAQGRTLDEIGTVYGVTRERIRQIRRDALAKLSPTMREWLTGPLPNALVPTSAHGWNRPRLGS